MNIFEQYGIKEVADVTLYAIELDKYDDEVYVPVLYFDTLKVSTVEQTAEQTSAKGGLGNPDLIMWDYGREITVSLEDALYTPASQSLMWGGKFGTKHSKIYGAWNPYIYEKDKWGKSKYLNRVVVDTEPTDTSNSYCFICPCDGQKKWAIYSAATAKKVDNVTPINTNFHGMNLRTYTYDGIKNCFTKDKYGVGLEKAEITIDNFGKFNFDAYSVPENASSESMWTLVTVDESTPVYCEKAADVYEYVWDDTDIKLTSLEGSMDIYYAENVILRYLTEVNGTNEQILVSQKQLYNYSRLNSKGYKDTTSDTINDVINSYSDSDTEMKDDGAKIIGIKYSAEAFDKNIVFYINLNWQITDCEGEISTHIVRVPVGEFYVVEDWNYQSGSIEDKIYPINAGIEDVPFLERMEKCKASQTFAINTDRNTRSNNYRYVKEYDNTELIVFIDPKTMKPFEPNTDSFLRKNGQEVHGNLRIIKQHEVYYKWTRTRAPEYTTLGHRIVVDAVHYPGVYKLVGETYARSRKDGRDQRYQFEIPLCKMSAETNLTLEAAGDPTTFTMNMKVLRREDGVMMKITQYNVDTAKFDGYGSGSTKVVPSDGVISSDPDYPDGVQ